MHSLFDALLAHHARQLTPVRCARSTIAQLHRFFEDIVLENNLAALVIEGLPAAPTRSPREIARLSDLARASRRTFLFVAETDGIAESLAAAKFDERVAPILLRHPEMQHANEHFVVIADNRFSAVLATVRDSDKDGQTGEDDVVWTFEPDVVYSALEYLQARVGAEHPHHTSVFGSAVRTSMPKATSMQLTLSVTTKLAHLLQEQTGREIAVNRIATAIRESLELDVILQKTVTELGAALNVGCCALRVERRAGAEALHHSYFATQDKETTLKREDVVLELDEICAQLAKAQKVYTRDGSANLEPGQIDFPLAVIPLVFHERFIGALWVIDDNPARIWQENEMLLLRTVANQLVVAINHADLFAQMQEQALTDALTGCHNRRSLEIQLDRELPFATRLQQPVSLLMVDLDLFKQLNDAAGHEAGDAALRQLADCFRRELRGNDTAARYGGDEFALVLPHAYPDGAQRVAERLRAKIEQIEIPGFGRLSASIGIASFPTHAKSRTDLIARADAALYKAKRAGRNQVAVFESSYLHGSDRVPVAGPVSETFDRADVNLYKPSLPV